jgi:NAD+ kinase
MSVKLHQDTINIFENGTSISATIARQLRRKLSENGYTVTDVFDRKAALTVCIGGDGSLLNMLGAHDFPVMPIAGINTGHLGFFQEFSAKELDKFIAAYKQEKFTKQTYRTVYAEITEEDGTVTKVKGLNEIVIRGGLSHAAFLNIYIGDSFIEKFCGDGIVVSTPAGSTAYNDSLGGSIVDPRLDLLQVTPIAAIKSSVYRSFTSSILLPPDLSLRIIPEYPKMHDILVTADGIERDYSEISEIRAGFNKAVVTLLRFKQYGFWNTVKEKLL